MLAPARPVNEDERTAALEKMALVYSPAEARFDRITRLAKKYFDVKIALVSLVYKDLQWFKSAQGLDEPCTSREVSFCGHAIHQNSALVVKNTLLDDRFKDNPLVVDGLKIRFYAGQPLKNKNGLVLGTLCIIDTEPRDFTEEDELDLKDFASWVESEFNKRIYSPVVEDYLMETSELERASLVEPISGAWNKVAFAEVMSRELKAAHSWTYSLGLYSLKIKNWNAVEEQYGQKVAGDIIKQTARCIRECAEENESLGYGEAGVFFLACPFHDEKKVSRLLTRLEYTFSQPFFINSKLKVTLKVDIVDHLLSRNLLDIQADEWLGSVIKS
jgi:GGDEF domain-containing protein